MTPNADRFKPFHESLLSTVARTGAIAIVIASVLTLVRLHRLPTSGTEAWLWFALFAAMSWPSFGGHWVELVYLNILRPKFARGSDSLLMLVRLIVWLAGGAILFTGAAITYALLMTGTFPSEHFLVRASLMGGPLLVGVEFIVHFFLLISGRPSFWNCRG